MRILPGLLTLSLAATLAATLATGALAQVRYHVDDDAAPGGDGLSWATAFDSLDDFSAIAGQLDKAWVAVGTYRPAVRQDAADPRSVTFFIPQATRVYGGFAGNETTFDQRAGLYSQTHLDGDVGVAGDSSDNAYHVVLVDNPSGPPPGATFLDGFRISGGSGANQGGGVKVFNSAMNLVNCIIENNSARDGAGVHAQPGMLEMRSCTLRGNRAWNNGGGLWGQAIELRIFNNVFAGNVSAERGGGVYLHSSPKGSEFTLFANCLFHDNVSRLGGGAFVGGSWFTYGTGTFRNCTFAFNRALESGGAIRAITFTAFPARVQVHNSIVWHNRAPVGDGVFGRTITTYSNLEGGTNGLFGNFSAVPGFVDASLRDFHLAPGSPGIDRGDNFAVAADRADVDTDGDTDEKVPLDLDGNPRFVDDPATPDQGNGTAPIVDLGAYEF